MYLKMIYVLKQPKLILKLVYIQPCTIPKKTQKIPQNSYCSDKLRTVTFLY